MISHGTFTNFAPELVPFFSTLRNLASVFLESPHFPTIIHKMSQMQNLSRDGHGKSRNSHRKFMDNDCQSLLEPWIHVPYN